MRGPGSIRLRLTLWNVAVLASVLAGFGAALTWRVRATVMAGVDRELAARMQFVSAEMFMPFPGRRFHRHRPGPPPYLPGMGNPATGGGWPGWEVHIERHEAGTPPAVVPAPPVSPGVPSSPPNGNESEVTGFEGVRFLQLMERLPPLPLPGGAWDAPAALEAAAAGRPRYATVIVSGQRVRLYSQPFAPFGMLTGVLQVAQPLAEQERLLAGLTHTLLALIPLALGAAALGGAFLTGRALRPVRAVTRAAAELSARDLSRRLPVTGNDEFSELATTFNGMLGRLEDAFARLESACEQQRRFAGDASHELRTPLTVLKANTSLALSGERTGEQYRQALVAADAAADTMTRIVQDLLLLVRSDGGQLQLDLQPVSVADVMRRAAANLPLPERPPLRFELPAGLPPVQGDLHHLARLFSNLLENALRHTPPEGEVVVRAAREEGMARIEVHDTGEGIPPEHLPHVCERFYRVDAARSHGSPGPGARTGLGLAICLEIARTHGGELHVASQAGRGTTVTVRLPTAPGADGAPSPSAPRAAQGVGSPPRNLTPAPARSAGPSGNPV